VGWGFGGPEGPPHGPEVIRAVVLVALVAGAIATIAIARRRNPPEPDAASLTWIVDAHQLGPVGYRDPAGAISPDGQWIAYSEGRFLRVRPVGGGPSAALPPNEAQIRNLTWSPDSQKIIADGYLTPAGWALFDRTTGTRQPLWSDHDPLSARFEDTGAATTAKVSDLRQLAWSRNSRFIAGIVNGRDGQELWTVSADGSLAQARRVPHRIAFAAWTPQGEVACIATIDGRQRITSPCGGAFIKTDPDLDVYGPFAYALDGATVYASLANAAGTVDLWAIPLAGGRSRRLTSFSRDTYAPSIAADRSVAFKVQSYRTVVALADAGGGPARPLATFQSETPSWDPAGRSIGITYGTWRRVVDDAKYPDIAQEAGIIAVNPDQPASQPTNVVHASSSEDQSLCWSPNGRWIAFHSHKDQSDDIWLREANERGDAPARRISFLGRGAETGWPRWSPDGRWLLFEGASNASHRSVAYIAGVDQETGEVTRAPQEISIGGAAIANVEVGHGEWLPDSAHFAIVGKEGPGRHVIFTVASQGGEARVVHRFASEHDTPGLGVSPDGRELAFIAPAPDGFFQIYRLPLAGGTATQVTSDPSHKTQPAWSPDGKWIAFTVWNYDVQFWRTR
jgi:Tol biopolymer transport system component